MEFREKIKRKAASLFFQIGIKKVKMDTIAQELKVSKRTIYEYFRNKDSLIRETLDLIQDEQNEINKRILEESDNIIEAVLGLLKNGSELLAGINPRYYTDLQRLYPEIWNEKIRQSKFHSYQLILSLLKRGKDQGIYKKEIKEEIIARILLEQLYLLSDQDIFPSREFSISEIYENIIISMTRGVATQKGLDLLEKHQEAAKFK
ncbi:MAG: TetR/AcrR family transcriptional regulator [Desulfovibrionales bacterium]|nr:TetR/AcrR family transcriptional regulator [Desulfovibrionales bacterium]